MKLFGVNVFILELCICIWVFVIRRMLKHHPHFTQPKNIDILARTKMIFVGASASRCQILDLLLD